MPDTGNEMLLGKLKIDTSQVHDAGDELARDFAKITSVITTFSDGVERTKVLKGLTDDGMHLTRTITQTDDGLKKVKETLGKIDTSRVKEMEREMLNLAKRMDEIKAKRIGESDQHTLKQLNAQLGGYSRQLNRLKQEYSSSKLTNFIDVKQLEKALNITKEQEKATERLNKQQARDVEKERVESARQLLAVQRQITALRTEKATLDPQDDGHRIVEINKQIIELEARKDVLLASVSLKQNEQNRLKEQEEATTRRIAELNAAGKDAASEQAAIAAEKERVDTLNRAFELQRQINSLQEQKAKADPENERLIAVYTEEINQKTKERNDILSSISITEKELGKLMEMRLSSEDALREIEARKTDSDNAKKRAETERQRVDAVKELEAAYKRLGALEVARVNTKDGTQERLVLEQQIAAEQQHIDSVANNVKLTEEETARIERQRLENSGKLSSAIAKHVDGMKDEANTADAVERATERVWRRFVEMAALRWARKVWTEALDYAKEYYDALNEIRLVTLKSEEEAANLGVTIRALAQEMNVTSTELAGSATALYRQGLDDDAVIGRLKAITEWATIAGMSVEEATTLMTSAINNFIEEGQDSGELAMHIADVYSLYGDSVATDSESIGKAMQKVSASAKNAGVEMENVAAYAATIMSVTQQEAETVGNALNTIITRYSRITKTGFGKTFTDDNGETVNVNDVIQALSEGAGIQAYDNQTKTFKDFSVVLDELAAKWGSLDMTQRNYVANAMAGTRQYNMILTLLQNYGTAVELIDSAMYASGTTQQKYAIWTESVTAAQNDLANSLEDLYGLMNADYLKTFYHAMATLIDLFTDGTNAMKGFNIAIPAIGVGLGGAVLVVGKLTAAFKSLGTVIGALKAGKGWSTAISGINMGGMISGVTAGVTAALAVGTLVVGAIRKAQEAARQAYNDAVEEVTNNNFDLQTIGGMSAKLEQIGDKAEYTSDELESLNNIKRQILELAPEIAAQYGIEADTVLSQAEAYEVLKVAIEDAAQAKRDASFAAGQDSIGESRRVLNEAAERYYDYQNGQITFSNQSKDYIKFYDQNEDGAVNLDDGIENYKKYRQELLDAKAALMALQDEYEESARAAADARKLMVASFIDPNLDTQTYNLEEFILGNIDSVGLIADEYTELLADVAAAISGDDFVRTVSNSIMNATTDTGEFDRIAYEEAVEYTAALQDAMSQYLGDQADNVKSGLEPLITAYEEAFAEGYEAINGVIDGGIDEEDLYDLSLSELTSMTYAIGSLNGQTFASLDELKAYMNTYFEYVEDVAEETVDYAAKIKESMDKVRKARELDKAEASNYSDAVYNLTAAYDTNAFMETITAMYSENSDLLDGLIEKYPALMDAMKAAESGDQVGMWEALDELQRQYDDAVLATIETEEEHADRMGELASSYYDLLSAGESVIDMMDKNKDATDAARKEYSELDRVLKKVENGEEITEEDLSRLNREISAIKVKKVEDLGEAWEGTADAIENAGKNDKDYQAASKKLIGNVTDMVEAQKAYNLLAKDGVTTSQESQDALKTLASYTGIAAEMLANDLSPAATILANDMMMGGNSAQYLFAYLSAVSGVTFTAANWQSQLSSLSSSSDATAAAVARLLSQLLSLDGTSISFTDGVASVNWGGAVLPTLPSVSGGGGGGGGGGSSKSGTNKKSASEKLINRMQSKLDLVDHAREIAQAAQAYHEARGEIQGVILYMQKEIDIVNESNVLLESNVANLETRIAAKQREISGLKEGSAAYNKVGTELDKLQEAHQKYSLELLKNKTDVEELTQSIKDQYDAIREMEIELRDTIMQAIEDREELYESMLEGRIDAEETLLDIVRERYERERDEIKETIDLRKQALEDEKDAIDELLKKQKEQAEQADKLRQIQLLESKISTISADPTRAKEVLDLQKQLAKLRDELAWDTAEAEAEAQKEAIDQQITSLEDYADYVDEYYEEILNNPRKMIEEIKYLLDSSDEEILQFLRENSEEYKNATDATREQMTRDWQDTLDQMRGIVRTYWDEVESIIMQGDDAIIDFLKENTADYKSAGKLQAEAYVDEWKKQLDDLKKAYKTVTGDIESYHYTALANIDSTGTGSGGSGGGSGGGGGGGTKTTSSATTTAVNAAIAGAAAATTGTYTMGYKTPDGRWVTKRYNNTTLAKAFEGIQSMALADWNAYSPNSVSVINSIERANVNNMGQYLKKYAKGGLLTETGPVMVHGSEGNPERILSARQNKLFEALVGTLTMFDTLPAFRMNSFGADKFRAGAAAGGNVTVNLSVGAINDHMDIKEVAHMVGREIMKETFAGSSVSGIRI